MLKSVKALLLWLFAISFSLAHLPGKELDPQLWEHVLRGEVVLLMRHALAPGTGDPSNFRIGDCSTQRNLSEAGRAQARQAGNVLRERGLRSARVLTSQWCRCRETATELNLGPVEERVFLNSFFATPQQRETQTRALLEFLENEGMNGPMVLVTHQVNITALTGVFPQSGEIIFLRPDQVGGVAVVGRFLP